MRLTNSFCASAAHRPVGLDSSPSIFLQRIYGLSLTWCLLLLALPTWAQERMTAFDPQRHGFQFKNTFSNDVVSQVDLRTGGLCGGMTYAALDFFKADMAIPGQIFRPANGTRLQRYLLARQIDSMLPNLTKWAELGLNPAGARDAEFFSWGLNNEFRNLRRFIDAGEPVPLGLQAHTGKSHQVLAIGYAVHGDGSLREIYVYDPNWQGQVSVIRPNASVHLYDQLNRAGAPIAGSREPPTRWRTYFVDHSYTRRAPPLVPLPLDRDDGRIRELVVRIDTGDDDLRGGDDNVSVIVHLRDGRQIVSEVINLRMRWLSNYTEHAMVTIPPTRLEDIVGFEITTSFRGGIGGDNWDVQLIEVSHRRADETLERLASHRQFARFTGALRSLHVPRASAAQPAGRPGELTRLAVVIRTGSDDLRGNEDNASLTLRFRDGTSQSYPVVNQRRTWNAGQEQLLWLDLPRPLLPSEVVELRVETSARGGFGGDNWNIDEIVIHAGPSREHPVLARESGRPLARLNAERRSYRLRW